MTPTDTTGVVTLTLHTDHAWVLGVVVVTGLWTLAIGAVWWASDVLRWLHNNYRTGRKLW